MTAAAVVLLVGALDVAAHVLGAVAISTQRRLIRRQQRDNNAATDVLIDQAVEIDHLNGEITVTRQELATADAEVRRLTAEKADLTCQLQDRAS